MKKAEIAAYALSAIDVSRIPTEIKILPLGHISTTKGSFEVDDESCRCIISQFKNRKLDLVIDYEHQTLEDVQAPASGWIKELYQGADALIAKVEWTPKAKDYLANKEYRYLSPVVIARKSDNKAIILHSAALTNTPAIDGMFAIINSDEINFAGDKGDKNIMDLEKLIKLLGLPDTATEEDVSAKLGEIIAKSNPENDTQAVANKTVLTLLGLAEDAKTEDVTAKIMSYKAGDQGITTRLQDLEREVKERKADDLVQLALKDGKISAAQKEWATQYAMSDSKGFKAFIEKAPSIVPVGKINYAVDQNSGNRVDLKILKNLGISEEDYKKYSGGEENE